jgi:hypothetical protein
MKDNDRNDDKSNDTDHLTPTPTRANKNKKGYERRSEADKSPRRQKKPFLEVWRSYSRVKQLEIILAGLAAAGVVGYLIAYIVVSMKQNTLVQMQHMPLVINSRAPQFLQPFICDAEKGFHTGNMQTAVKNIGNASAQHVIPYVNSWKIIPEKKTGNPFFDELPEVNCKMHLNAKELESPLAPGREAFPQIRQMVGTLPPISKTDPIQLYWVSCVYYSDEYGDNHGTCDTYRLLFSSTNPLDVLSGSPTFFCDATPKMGKFAGTITGHCQE